MLATVGRLDGEEVTAATLGGERWLGGIFKRLQSVMIKRAKCNGRYSDEMRIFEYNGVVLRWFNRVYMFKAQVIKMFIGLSMILKSRPAKCGKATILTTFFWPGCLNFKNLEFRRGFSLLQVDAR